MKLAYFLNICVAVLGFKPSVLESKHVEMISKNGHEVPFPVFSTFAASEEDYVDECGDERLISEEIERLNPNSPLVPCRFLDERWIDCNDPVEAPNGANRTKTIGTCLKFGGTRYDQVERTNVSCRVLPCIECRGNRVFYREVPCIKYTGHYFLSTVLYSIFLGVLAVDRFCLGYSAIAVGKLMTLGGLGVWWLVDIFLLLSGRLMPADGSNWQPYY